MTLRSALLAAAAMVLPAAAYAQPVTGLYVGLGAGVNGMQNEHVKGVPGGVTSGDIRVNIGPAVVASVGYGLGNGLRFEVEGDYRNNSLGHVTNAPVATGGGGTEQKAGAMFNALYDFVGLTPFVQPYVGIGGGYIWTIEQNLHFNTPTSTVAAGRSNVGRFAYQGILGAAFPVTSMPGLAVTAEYRFLGLVGDRNYSATTTTGGVVTAGDVKLNSDYNHSFLIGIRYNFGQAPAPVAAVAAPVPAVAPARSYLVFFDWDKATLTDRARQIISEAAANSTKVQYTQIQVNGYTDTSGTPRYNQGLSVRRAQAVAAELVKDGVPKAAISIQGFGETHLLVPTGPGVREPQNRRVEIIIK